MTVETVIFSSVFTVIGVNRHRSISLAILSMESDTYKYIMSLSVVGKKRFTLKRMHAPWDYIV